MSEPEEEDNCFQLVLNQELLKMEELQASEAMLARENLILKLKYNNLQSKVQKVSGCIEGNCRILTALLDDARSAFQLCRVTTKGPLSVSREVNVLLTSNIVPRRTIEAAPQQEHSERPETENLTVILEESSLSGKKQVNEPVVKLTRLSAQILEKHLDKQNYLNNCTMDCTLDFSQDLHPGRVSTPLKIQNMKSIGLIPVSTENFVTLRRRDEKKENTPQTEPINKRPQRKAKPQKLAEESLKTYYSLNLNNLSLKNSGSSKKRRV